MQRHGHEQFRLAQQRGPGARHQRRERGRHLGPVGVLERQDQPPRVAVVAERRAGAAECGGAARQVGQRRSGPPSATVAKGTPQQPQHGSVTKPVRPKHSGQRRPGASTGASQVTHCGGSSRSRAATPTRRAPPKMRDHLRPARWRRRTAPCRPGRSGPAIPSPRRDTRASPAPRRNCGHRGGDRRRRTLRRAAWSCP